MGTIILHVWALFTPIEDVVRGEVHKTGFGFCTSKGEIADGERIRQEGGGGFGFGAINEIVSGAIHDKAGEFTFDKAAHHIRLPDIRRVSIKPNGLPPVACEKPRYIKAQLATATKDQCFF
jgi:hypothetical protein